jgi:O-antigen/teichoic acid export membrane protein
MPASAMFSPSIAGMYLLSHRVLAMPMTLIGKAIADVFFSNAAEARRNGELPSLVAAIHNRLTQIAMPAALVIIIAGPDLFHAIFGDQWKQSGEFAQWMAIFIYFQFVTSPLSLLVSVLEKQAHGSIFQIVLFIVQLAGLLAGALYGDPIFAVAFFALGSAICYFAFLAWIMRETQNRLSLIFIPSLKAFIWGIILVAPLLLFYMFSDNAQLWFGAVGLSGLLVMSRYLFIARQI